MNLEEIKKKLVEELPNLRVSYSVERIGIFGSYTRNEQDDESDVDVLVEFSKPVGFFHFLHLENYLTSSLGIRVDLVTKDALKPAMREEIINALITV
ncbi:MAG: nucleotidyltransferase family protein [Ignavibacteriae bacterium]|nr:nucleotidyltransferase family protein [Ignavibacteriota bacterium]